MTSEARNDNSILLKTVIKKIKSLYNQYLPKPTLMKTKLTLMFFAVGVNYMLAQTKLESPVADYNADRLWTTYTDINTQEKDSVQLLNYKMLNLMFANKVGTGFAGSNDLSLQKFYASLDANDKSFTLGANFDSRRGKPLAPLQWVLSTGVKIKSANDFATVYKNGDFQEDNIGATLKATFVFDGNVNFTSFNKKDFKKLRMQAIQNHHKTLEAKYNAEADKFNTESLSGFTTKINNADNYDSDVDSLKEELKKKKEAAYIEMAKEEVAYIETHKMYKYITNKWISVEVYAPFGENTYRVTPDLSTALSKKYFYAFTSTLSANYMRQYSNGISLFFKGNLDVKHNNNIMVDNLESQAFQSTALGANNTTVITNSTDGYVTNYDQFVTTAFTFEPAFFFINNTIGFSPAIEFNLGTYDKTNWKLVVPISLKDSDGKPKVNFEIQWKEVNTFTSSTHLVGLSASFLFGDMIN